ncbi:MAG TPA: TIGR04255 family protein [Rhizomicrobium sp.]|jgi:uncharacterized protein (TIGR04255 family)|nr:TIGR04255 family protein [Rhizomicrobium sp.]
MAAPKKLPKAPLVEVVFELRWELQHGPAAQPVLQTDPGILPLLNGFTNGMKTQGFKTFRDMSHPLQTGAYGVVRRFYKKADKPFPIMQIGPGIFAANASQDYLWEPFKSQILSGSKALLGAYPKLDFFALRPSQLELRYVDAFDKSILGRAALFEFTEKATSLRFGLPPMLNKSDIFSGDAEGRFFFQRDLKAMKDTTFVLDVASAKNNETNEGVVRMESKVISLRNDVPKLGPPAKFINDLGRWLETAHNVLSPFFKQFILPDVMKKFAAK